MGGASGALWWVVCPCTALWCIPCLIWCCGSTAGCWAGIVDGCCGWCGGGSIRKQSQIESFNIFNGGYSEIESKNESKFGLSLVEQFAFSKYYKNFLKDNYDRFSEDSNFTSVISNDTPFIKFVDQIIEKNTEVFSYFGAVDNSNYISRVSEENKEISTMQKLEDKKVKTHKIEMSEKCIIFDYPKRVAEFLKEDIICHPDVLEANI